MICNLCQKTLLFAALLVTASCHYHHREYDETSYLKTIEEMDQGSMIPAADDEQYAFSTMQELPISKHVVKGVLENGLTYYVHQNKNHQGGLADIELVINVGSLVEEDDEVGIAHFVEHMAFGGTKHYPGNSAIESMRRIGIAYGDGFNAVTSHSYTSYHLYGVPVGSAPQLVDSCMYLLRDMASECTMDERIVERERSIILEEIRYRSSETYHSRFRDIWAGTLYAKRTPIGTAESVSSISGDAIRHFYRKWYQPQNMAVIVSGNIDPEKTVEIIKKEFSTLERGKTQIPHFAFNLQQHREPRAFVYQDKTITKAEVLFTFNIANDSLFSHRNTLTWYVDQKSRDRLKTIINQRLQRMRDELYLFDFASSGDEDDISEDKPFTIALTMEPAHWQLVISSVGREIEKICRYGLTEKEAKNLDMSLNCDNKVTDSVNFNSIDVYSFMSELDAFYGATPIRNSFIFDDYLLDSPTNQVLADHCKRMTPGFCRSHFEKITDDSHLTICLSFPDNCDVAIPDKQQILEAYNSGREADLDSEKYRFAEEPNFFRMAHELSFDRPPGKLVDRRHNYFKNRTTLTLSNGVIVEICYSDYHIFQLNGVRYGAMSNYSDADAKKLKMLPYIAADPYSFGKSEARLWIGEEHDTFRMKSVRMSGEDMLKVALFSLMNTEIDSVRFCNYKQKLRSQQPLSKSYAEHINELWTNTVYADEYAERMAPMSPEDIDALTLDEMRRLSEDYRSNFNGMHFAIESGYPKDYIEPLIIKYLGMLPSKSEAVVTRDIPAMHFKNKSGRSTYTYVSDNPKANVFLGYIQEKNFTYSIEENVLMEAFTYVLDELLDNNIRFAEGRVYSFGVNYNHIFIAGDKRVFTVHTTCDPLTANDMLNSIDSVIKEMAEGELITQSIVNNYINIRMKTYHDYPDRSEYFDYLTSKYQNNGKVVNTFDENVIKSVTPQRLRSFIQSIIRNGNKQELVLVGQRSASTNSL